MHPQPPFSALQVLYHLFELPELKGSRCILIGVANNIDLTVRLLPRLQARGWEPHMVTFPAYNAQELATLLEQVASPLPLTRSHSLDSVGKHKFR
jgi:cell division control protein 6